MAFVDGYEKVSPSGKCVYSAPGTEKEASGSGPGPSWAKRSEKGSSDSNSKKY